MQMVKQQKRLLMLIFDPSIVFGIDDRWCMYEQLFKSLTWQQRGQELDLQPLDCMSSAITILHISEVVIYPCHGLC